MTAAEVTADVAPGFSAFYRSAFGALAAYGGALARDEHLGDEFAQEALTRVYVRWGLLRDPRPYAFRIVLNLSRDHWRDDERERSAQGRRVAAQTVPGPDTGLLDAVQRLPPPLCDVIVLHYYADLPVAVVARVLRRPPGTVKRRLAEARTALARVLAEGP